MVLKNCISSEKRRKKLKQLLKSKGFVRILEAHNGITAIIVNDAEIEINNKKREFDGIWESSLTDSASKGYPDIDIIGFESRCENLRQILDSSAKPVIFDGDTGGEASNFEYMVRRLENLGVSAVIIEDKTFPKRNSLSAGSIQTQENLDIFSTKIKRGREVLMDKEFMIIARIESLISGAGMKDALRRAKKYLQAGVDGIMIHSKNKTPEEVLEFAQKYNELCKELKFRKPLVCVPTTYNTITEQELRDKGFNIVIYANQLLRASYKSMKEVARTILLNQRSFETDPLCCEVKELFDKVGFSDIKKKDQLYSVSETKVIIPAAGEDNEFIDIPKAMLEIKGKSILQRQVDVLNKTGLRDIAVIRGYQKDKFNVSGVKYIDNKNYSISSILYSLFCAEEEMKKGFIYINSDILFNEKIIKRILDSDEDIILVADNSYEHHKHNIEKELDLVLTKYPRSKERRVLEYKDNKIIRIGKKINKEMANYEFIGVGRFSEYGAEILKKVYYDCKVKGKGRFHESDNFNQASFTDIIQEIIDRGFKVSIL
ncbi:MAG: phosphoenolpyruvate mutase, partial [Candidatus Aenigmarchaeota archaeon]|nr:phosphoenolpyruvate mutase [Candidatus Aenigmarchaeota archaeon]